ncbi:hypothetical protein [Micromonospora arborensis]|uniref:hypothetical protein n=1 Tax=Micromonospora arborensis TaxID=2116518 RepID=UPI00371D6FF0
MGDGEDLRARLALGPDADAAWLTVAEIAELFSTPHRPVSRFAVNRWLKDGVTIEGARYVVRYKSPPAGRICHPEDVAALLEASERIRSADDAGAPAE